MHSKMEWELKTTVNTERKKESGDAGLQESGDTGLQENRKSIGSWSLFLLREGLYFQITCLKIF